MNQRLRNRHRYMVFAVAIIAPAVFFLSLSLRPDLPTANQSVPGNGNKLPTDAVQLSEESFSLAGASVLGQLYATTENPSDRHLRLGPAAGQAVATADVLVYWIATQSTVAKLPDDAYLLGTMAGTQTREFRLPTTASSGGQILFYSLAEQRLFDARWQLSPK